MVTKCHLPFLKNWNDTNPLSKYSFSITNFSIKLDLVPTIDSPEINYVAANIPCLASISMFLDPFSSSIIMNFASLLIYSGRRHYRFLNIMPHSGRLAVS